MIRLLKYLKPIHWVMVGMVFIIAVARAWLELEIPGYFSKITGAITTNFDPAQKSAAFSTIWKNGGIMLGLSIGSVACVIVTGFLTARIGAGFARNLRKNIFYTVESFSLQEINKFSTPSLLTRTTNDVGNITQAIMMSLSIFFYAPVVAVMAIVKITAQSTQLTLATAITIFCMVALISIIFVFVIPKFKSIQTLTDKLNLVTRESLSGMRVVRAYNAENYQQDKFEKVNEPLTRTMLFVNRATSLLQPIMSLLMNGLNLAIMWMGAYLVQKDGLSFSVITSFVLYARQIIMSFMMLIMVFIMIPRAQVSAKRIHEVLKTTSAIKSGAGAGGVGHGLVEYKNVSFKYPDAEEYVLQNISFNAKKGETVAFIGSTGSGKSTVIKLLPRFYDISEGQILLDGVPVKDYTLKQLRSKIGYVPQKATLFTGTIKSNIAYGDYDEENNPIAKGDEQKTEEEMLQGMQEAARIAKAEEFVLAREDGFDSYISRGGVNVSGGQKQRLSIARALYRKPEVYIFDDSFSALDYKTDKELRAALKESMSDATVLVVAQRIGTIINADKIIVLDNGKVVGEGRHEQLLQSCPVYKEIALSQLSEKELAL